MNDSIATQIRQFLEATDLPEGAWLTGLIDHILDQLPAPGSGLTYLRWQALAAVAEFDLSLAKLYEGHTDALAILGELEPDATYSTSGAWGVWAAEAPAGKAIFEPGDTGDGSRGDVYLRGGKCWCSGAATAKQALLTAWRQDGRGPYLVRVVLAQPSIAIQADNWQAVGMRGSASLDVQFQGATGHLVGREGQYLSRPGFWQGGAGIAACWYGGAVGLACVLKQSVINLEASGRSAFVLAGLGKIDLALRETALVLQQSASWIDANPQANAARVALLCRLSAENTASLVLREVGRAMGATPFCRNRRFAKAAADLPVFIRQSHAEKDFAALGEHSLQANDQPWQL